MWEYKTVDTRDEKGLKQAEKLKNAGWKISVSSLIKIQFYREK